MKQPYIYISDYQEHTEEVWQNNGIVSTPTGGAHGIFAARIPFIPSFLADDFTRMVASMSGRNEIITGRQIRFLNDLAHTKENSATFDLRFIANPYKNTLNKSDIDIFLLGKVFHQTERVVEKIALDLWGKVVAHFPLEDPYNYPLEPVTDVQEFVNCIEPISLDNPTSRQIVEIRKFEDHDPYEGATSLLGYHPHPFRPNLKFSAMGSLMETMARQKQRCVVSISLKPTDMFKDEIRHVEMKLHQYSTKTVESEGWRTLHTKERVDDLFATYWRLINQRSHLFMIKVQVVGEQEAPMDVVQALGSEFMDNTTSEPRMWAVESPGNQDELKTAVNNFRYLEHKIWRKEDIESQGRRLRFLVTAYEASGAFRLPIPPESGYLPGVLVRDEAFVLPSQLFIPEEQTPFVTLGEIIHRGTPTDIPFNIPLNDFKRHSLIAGATGSGKTNTCLNLLSQFWTKYKIPFLVLYPIDKPDYRQLMGDESIKDQLLIFTLGDETTSPFRFNPFYVPDGILLKTHISLLMRSFTAAFVLQDPLPAVYRGALRMVYQKHGWNLVTGKGGDTGVIVPTMSDFYDCLVTVANELTQGYGGDVKGNIRQASEIRIQDLLHNAGSVINVSEQIDFQEILSRPTVMELGRIGSSEDIALIMGFLLTRLTEELQSAKRNPLQKEQQHITLVEEAHRLMASGGGSGEYQADPKSKGSEDFSNILAEVRGFGEGIIIAEQIPTSLVVGAIGNTHVKVMHWLEDTSSFRLFGEILNLNERQQEYARTLGVGHCVVRGKSGTPIHILVDEYISDEVDDSDISLKNFMASRFRLPAMLPWSPPKQPTENLLANITKKDVTADIKAIKTAVKSQDWNKVRSICLKRVNIQEKDLAFDLAYAYINHLASKKINKAGGKPAYEVYPFLKQALENFK